MLYPYDGIGEGNGTPLQYSCLENPMDGGAWKAAVRGVAEGQTRLSEFIFTFHFHALEKEMATHSGVLAWRIPGMGEPGKLPSMGSHRVGHDWSDLAGLHRIIQLQLLQRYWLGHRLGLLWYWMVALETNRDHSVTFEIASKYCISDSFVDHDGYSISSKGFLPTEGLIGHHRTIHLQLLQH